MDAVIKKDVSRVDVVNRNITTTKMNVPSFMMVLTGTGDYAYRRKDGVYVVPIGCLKDKKMLVEAHSYNGT